MPYETIIKLIIKFLFKIDSATWAKAVDKVYELFLGMTTNDEKAQAFVNWARAHLPAGTKTWVIETLRNLAVAFSRRKGWIQ